MVYDYLCPRAISRRQHYSGFGRQQRRQSSHAMYFHLRTAAATSYLVVLFAWPVTRNWPVDCGRERAPGSAELLLGLLPGPELEPEHVLELELGGPEPVPEPEPGLGLGLGPVLLHALVLVPEQ